MNYPVVKAKDLKDGCYWLRLYSGARWGVFKVMAVEGQLLCRSAGETRWLKALALDGEWRGPIPEPTDAE